MKSNFGGILNPFQHNKYSEEKCDSLKLSIK